MERIFTMHKILNVIIDDCISGTYDVGFELDNKKIIYNYDGLWQESNDSHHHYKPVEDINGNTVGFIEFEVKSFEIESYEIEL